MSTASETTQGAPGRRAGGPRSTLVGGLHLAALWAFAVAQPLFSVLEKTPEFFAVRGSPPGDIVVFAVAVVVLPPLALTGIELLAGLASRRLAQALHLVFMALLTALFLSQTIEKLFAPPGSVAIALAVVGACGLVFAYARTSGLRTFLTVLSPAPLVFVAVFLFGSPVSNLVLPQAARAYAGSKDASRAPVVMIILDEFPVASLVNGREQVDRDRFPHLAALAADSTWFRHATTVSGFTTQSVPAIVTSNLHRRDIVAHISDDRARNMFTLLRGSHRLNVVETETHLCPADLCAVEQQSFGHRMGSLAGDLGVVTGHIVLPADLQDQIPSIADAWQDFNHTGSSKSADIAGSAAAEQAPGALMERFIRSVGRTAGRPTFSWLHVALPHRPFTYLPSGALYRGEPLPGLVEEGDRWVKDPWPVQQAYARELVQVADVDRMIGELTSTMKRAGIYRRSAIVITSDHGAAFTPGCNRRVLVRCNFDEIAGVPMIVKAPGQTRGRSSDKHVQTLDILPTIAGMLGVRIPWKVQGRNMLDPAYRGSDRVFIDHDPPLSSSLAAHLRARARALRHKLALFGPGGGVGAFFRIGPNRGLIGKRVAGRSVGSAAGASVELSEDPGAFEHVRPRSGFVPAFFRGVVSPADGPAHEPLAVAVNGRVAAVTRTKRTADGARWFAVLVPEAAFHAGRNDVQVYAVRGGGLARIERTN